MVEKVGFETGVMDAGSGDNEKVGWELNEEVSINIFEKYFALFYRDKIVLML